MKKTKVERYLQLRGCIYLKEDWTFEEFKELLDNNDIDFVGEETGSLKFCSDKRGKYIQFKPSKCYLKKIEEVDE